MGAGFDWIGLDWSLDQGNLIGANIAPEGGEWGLDLTGLDWIGVWIGSGQPDRRQYCAGGRRMGAGFDWIGLDWSLDQGNLTGANIAPEGGEWGLDLFA
jgi:hypothetical protein